MNTDYGITMLLSVIPSLISSGLGIAMYVLKALGLYTLAQRRGIHKPWLAWIPVADVWILGAVSDQYRYVARGEIRSKRKVLLTLNIISAVFTLILSVVAVIIVANIVVSLLSGMGEEQILAGMLTPALVAAGLSIPMTGVAIALVIIRYMALYDLYTSCEPRNATLFLVLSILISITEPFFIFCNRNKDLGMPPRRQDAPRQIVQPIREPWENPDKPNYL